MRFILTASFILAAAAAAQAGDLIPTGGGDALRVVSHKVDAGVDNQIAVVKVEQVFANDGPSTLEAHYVFPVPKSASIVDFSMTVNGKLMRGELLEKEKAARVYDEIVRKSRDPGLLEHVGANIFRVRVFPILPRTQQKIELTYVERVNYDAGVCRYVYPLQVPGSRGGTKTDRFEFRWRLASRVPIRDVSSATHRVAVARRTESEAEVTFDAAQADLSKDLEITYRIARPTSGMDLVAQRPGEEEGTFALLLTPKADAARLPKDMTFVFDTSGSMDGKRIKQAKAALQFCLGKLAANDRFNILSFSSDVVPFSPTHVAATEEAKDQARKFVGRMEATGGTNINDALLRALEHRPAEGRPHLILFLTDGQPTVGQSTPSAIVYNVLHARRGNERIFTFGVGDDLNKSLLEELADATQAVAEYVTETEDIEEKVSRLQTKIASPVMSGLKIDWGKAPVSAVYPRTLGDLYAGSQLLVAGRYSKGGSFEVILRGSAGGTTVELKQTIEFPEKRDASPGVPYIWAMRKVGDLLDELKRHGPNAEIQKEIIGLAKKYRVATPYTSFLVLESEAAYDQRGLERTGMRAVPPSPAVPPAETGKAYSAPGVPKVQRAPDVFERGRMLADSAPGSPTDEPAIFHPEAKESDHNESADNQDYHLMKGDSRDFLSYVKGESGGFRGRQAGRTPGVYDTMGVGQGAGGGGRYGARFGGRQIASVRFGGTPETETAVLAALKWLARAQQPDGSWAASDGESEVAATSLSLLAFLGAGYSHLSRDEYRDEKGVLKFGEVVKKACQFLITRQVESGLIGGGRDHALAAQALAEAYGMTASAPLKDPAQRAVDYLVASQVSKTGWRASETADACDLTSTAWAILALRTAEISDLSFPASARDGAISWVRSEADPRLGSVNDATKSLLSRILLDRRRSDPMLDSTSRLLAEPPEWKDKMTDLDYLFFGSQVVFHFDGGDGPRWKKWNEAMKSALVPHQEKDGSWMKGRTAATALGALTLEVYYRQLPVFGPRTEKK